MRSPCYAASVRGDGDTDGLLVEIHPRPDSAVSDRDQTLYFDQAAHLIEGGRKFRALREALMH